MIKSSIRNSELLKSTGIYTLAGFLNGSIIFLLMPFFTRLMSTEEYGMVSMFRTINSFVFPFIAFYASVGRMYFDRDKINFPRYVFNSILVICLNTVLVAIVLQLLNSVIYKYTLFPPQYLWTIVIFAFSTSIMKMGLVLFQVNKKPLLYGALQISATVVNLAVALLLVGKLGLNWKGAIFADTSVLAFFALVILLILAKRGLSPGIRAAYLKDILSYNIPLIFHLIGRGIITMSDKIFITNMVGLSETGIYAAGYQIAMVVFVISTAFQAAWMPHIYEILKRNNLSEKATVVKQIYRYSGLILLGSLALGILAPLITKVFLGSEFAPSSKYVIWIATGFAFNAIYQIISNLIAYAKKTHFLAIITLVGALSNIGLNYYLIKLNGAIGAAQSTAITFVLIAVLTWLFSNKAVKMPWFKLST